MTDLTYFERETEEENNNMDDPEVDDLCIDQILLIFVWNDDALRTRNIQKNNVIAEFQGFNGVQPIQTNCSTNLGLTDTPPSDSIFSITDTQTSNKQQIAEDIVSSLRRLHYQVNQVPLGRVYEIRTARKGLFEIKEYRDVF